MIRKYSNIEDSNYGSSLFKLKESVFILQSTQQTIMIIIQNMLNTNEKIDYEQLALLQEEVKLMNAEIEQLNESIERFLIEKCTS